MKIVLLLTLCVIIVPAFSSESMRGPLPAEQQEIIRQLAANHQKIERKVEWTTTGYRATTTSLDPDTAKLLIAHVRHMKARLDSGARVRNWDPAFAELVAFYDRMNTTIKEIPDGLEVEVRGLDADAVKVTQNHGRIVSGFVADGTKGVARKHTPAHVADPGVEEPQTHLRQLERLKP